MSVAIIRTGLATAAVVVGPPTLSDGAIAALDFGYQAANLARRIGESIKYC